MTEAVPPVGRRRAAAALAALALVLLLAACGSSKASSSAQTGGQACKRIEAVLSDGPDPEADPVGHAQAQILPLREIHTTDGKLASAIGSLDSAYQHFTASNGSNAAQAAVNSATKTVEDLCPGIEL